MQLDVVYRAPGEALGIWGPVVIRLLDGAPTERAETDRIHGCLAGVLAGWPSAGMLLISHHGTPSPSFATMRYAKTVMADIEDRVVLSVALLGLGYWAETARATTSWLMRILRGTTVILENSVEGAARSLAFELVGLDPEGVIEACEELDRRFRERG